MSSRFKSRVLTHVQDHRYEPVPFEQLADQMGIEDADLPELEAALDELISEGRVVMTSSGAIWLPAISGEVVGTISVNARGFGFITPVMVNREGDLFIPAESVNGAITGDTVRARVHRSRRRTGGRSGGGNGGDRSPFVGEVVEIIKRARTTIVGILKRINEFWLVEPDGRQLPDAIRVRDVTARNVKHGDKVVVQIIKYPEAGMWGEGVITERLGESGRPDVETQAVIRAYDLPGDFPEACLEQAASSSTTFADHAEKYLRGRENLREQFILTIDPPDAKDFDDAISIRRLDAKGDGVAGYELGVHIADVSTFVTGGSPLDEEARQRGNSVYLPRLVIPMLPEVLSNGVCSLQEGVDRLTKSVFIRFDRQGSVMHERYCNSVIRSSKRLTYLEAEALIKDQGIEAARSHAMSESAYPEGLTTALKLMDELAKVLRQRRTRDGMIVLSLPEVELQFDDEGHVIGAEPEDDASTHGLIEMFMVEANEAVARLFERLKVPILRRTHPEPSSFDLGELRTFFRVAGLNIPRDPTRQELQHVLEATRGTPRQQAVHLAVLKSLTKAEYSPAMIGHFALASAHYAHFTSPIRRYPDLVVHRQLDAYFDVTDNGRNQPKGKGLIRIGNAVRKDQKRCPSEDRLVEIGNRCNLTERQAESAERSLRIFLVLQFLAEKFQGASMAGVITNITSQAFFVQLDHYLVEGFVSVRDLNDALAMESEKYRRSSSGGGSGRSPQWRLNAQTGSLVASNTGATLSIGDRVKVELTLIDPPARRLDLRFVEKVGVMEGDGADKPKSGGTKVKDEKKKSKKNKHHQQPMKMKMKNKQKPTAPIHKRKQSMPPTTRKPSRPRSRPR